MADYYAQFDGDDIGGKRYTLGEKLADDVDQGAVTIMLAIGRIATQPPVAAELGLAASTEAMKPVADMSPAELKSVAAARFSAEMEKMDMGQLRDMVERMHAKDAAEEPTAKPLDKMTTAELNATAADEGVTFGDDVKTNADRVKAIQAKRDAANA